MITEECPTPLEDRLLQYVESRIEFLERSNTLCKTCRECQIMELRRIIDVLPKRSIAKDNDA